MHKLAVQTLLSKALAVAKKLVRKKWPNLNAINCLNFPNKKQNNKKKKKKEKEKKKKNI